MLTYDFKQKNALAFQGDLSVITIENLMQLVGSANLYGELQLTTSNNSAVFFVNHGSLVYSYIKKNPMKLGQRLIQGNFITNEHLQECLSLYQQEVPRPKIGKILVEKKYLLREDLEKVLKEQSKDIFFEAISWRHGSFAFFVKRIPKGEDIFLDERIDKLTLEGVIHLDELSC